MNKKFKKFIKSVSDSELEDIAQDHNVNIDGFTREDAEFRVNNDLTDGEKKIILETLED